MSHLVVWGASWLSCLWLRCPVGNRLGPRSVKVTAAPRLKAAVSLCGFSARLKPRPFKTISNELRDGRRRKSSGARRTAGGGCHHICLGRFIVLLRICCVAPDEG